MKIKIEVKTKDDYVSTYLDINAYSKFTSVFKRLYDLKNKIIQDNGFDESCQAEVIINNKIKFFI
jgi:hypothetical protein